MVCWVKLGSYRIVSKGTLLFRRHMRHHDGDCLSIYWTWEKPAHMCHVKKDMGTALPERAGRTSGKRGCVEKE